VSEALTDGNGASLQVLVDEEACCGSGRCADTEPEVFDQSEDGTVLLRRPTVSGALAESVRLCAELCPCDAIRVEGFSA
jgi:ferredoxin